MVIRSLIILLLVSCTPIDKPDVCVKDTVWQLEPDGTYIGEVRLYSDSLKQFEGFVQPYDFGLRRSHIYINIRRDSLIDYYRKKETIIELLNFNYDIVCPNER